MLYITTEALPTILKIKIINLKKYSKVMLDKNIEAFEIHIAFSNSKIKKIINLA